MKFDKIKFDKIKFDKTKFTRLDTIFSYWILLFTIIYFLGYTSYNPLFVLIIALICNIFVVSGNCYNYIKAGNLNLKLLIPYLIGSIPLAFIGGSLQLDKNLFEIFCLPKGVP